MIDFLTLLKEPGFVLLDGGMGTQLQGKGLPPGAVPELVSLEHPDWVLDIHRAYLRAGAQVIYANTFGASAPKLAPTGHTPAQVIAASVALAREAVRGTDALVALDLGPIGQLLEPTGTLSFEAAYALYAEQAVAGAGADLAVLETRTDLYEVKAALLAVRENTNLPVLATMSFEANGRTFLGCDLPSIALTLEGLGADAVGINCSLGPRELLPLAEELARWTTLPLVMKPNAGLPDPGGGGYDITPAEFATHMVALARLGVKCLGGCCGTTPEYIALLRGALAQVPYAPRPVPRIPAAVCSGTRTVSIDRVRIIGERINPTGKKRLQEALLREDMDYLLGEALRQTEAGADILDVNVGIPGVDEPALMARAVGALQSVTDAPLQLDSCDPLALEAGLRAYNGKAVVNSVNGKDEVLDAVLPLVKKYGAAVVGLTLDHNGIPKTAEQRLQIARHILARALAHGIRREDVYIDPLTLTVSAEPEGAGETLCALRRIKDELDLKTVLGVSNISFGLPNRAAVNQNFLALALEEGLDLPILNPNVEVMTAAVRCYHLLHNVDRHAAEFLAAYGGTAPPPAPTTGADRPLGALIALGLKGEAGISAQRLLASTPPLEVVDGVLIPALDQVGADFEAGRVFLPQLIQSAAAAQAAFEAVRAALTQSGGTQEDKGTVVLATVQGDIHDIGKNIVKVLLENYGYAVVDLGRDVAPGRVTDAVKRHNAGLVGLSALMTTTLGAMAETIALLRRENLSCQIVVGGAVLTGAYAAQIGADFYAKDAKESVDIAKRVFGQV